MSSGIGSALADTQEIIVDLRRQLEERAVERDEAQSRETAIAEILAIINASPGDLAPVFEAILGKAHALCGAELGSLFLYHGELFRAATTHGCPEDLAQRLRRGVVLSAAPQLLAGARWVHHPDLTQVDTSTARAVSGRGGVRTHVALPLRKDGRLLGAISCNRREVRPFSDEEIALLESFAPQAVIAIENARLMTETRERTRDLEESLEYQTATSDVLEAISRSTFDLQPVLDIVCETAARLCGADDSSLATRDGDVYRLTAHAGISPEHAAMLRSMSFGPSRGSVTGRVLLEGRTIQIPDMAADADYERTTYPAGVIVDMRTMLGVPLLREGDPIGVFVLRRRRVEPFTGRQIELVRTFGDQAVIAIENTRLITETREALEQQQAMAEVLEVINRAPGDLQPVFDAILEKAHILCGASRGSLFLFDGEVFRAAASQGYSEGTERPPRAIAAAEDPRLSALIAGERMIHVPDLTQLDDPIARAVSSRGGVRTNLLLPLRKDGALLGVLGCNRAEVRPFSDNEIALLESFAAQAVIAMDNARLLDEIRRRQAELRVTFDSMGDGVAMFDGELRLAAWNRNFQTLLDLPGEFLAEGPSFAEYFGYLAERGEYASADLEAELRRSVEDAALEARFECTRPDGGVIEVRRNPVPGGGFVLMYGDITERTRAEAEIHAARDAAEKALGELRATQQLVVQQKMAALGH